jgi:alpha-1,3-mannosyltransferase
MPTVFKQAMTLLSSPFSLFGIELVLCTYSLFFVRYTEIDWRAYMQEVEGFLGGELNYELLRGDTGPLVYPAGFVYLYAGLRWLTDEGTNIWRAQCFFTGFYVMTLAVVAYLYRKSKAPGPLLLCLVLSKRVHSIFILRLFNDGIAMLFLYVAAALFVNRRWSLGSVMYSLAVSVKMNVFLFAPGLLHIYLTSLGFFKTVQMLSICAVVQVALGAPFLLHNWVSYLKKAFELSRVFTYIWTVNFKFLPEEIFVSPILGMALLALTLVSWATLYQRRWRNRTYTTPQQVLSTLFESNIIGVAFSRTLHYQFYVWFFHSLPYVLWSSCGQLWPVARVVVMIAIEIGFNVFPSVWWSSAMVEASLLLVAIYVVTSSDHRGMGAAVDSEKRTSKATR